MNTLRKVIWMLSTALISCSGNEKLSDAYGNFEAQKIVISSEANGKIVKLDLEEGQNITQGQRLGFIDTTELCIKKEQLQTQIKGLQSNFSNISSQKKVFEQQKENLLIDKKRILAMLASNAATQKQFDDINGAISVIDKQISSVESQNQNINSQIETIQVQIKSIVLAISKCYIISPIHGTILNKLAYENELTMVGKQLFTVANLNSLDLKVYISGSQLSSVKLGQSVEVLYDDAKESVKKKKGKISWISETAEFTPKTIQTKEERINYVYAVKIKVDNDAGDLKIGMPAEVNFK